MKPKRILKGMALGLAGLLAAGLLADLAWVHGPALLAGRRIEAVNGFAREVSGLTVPEEARVIALGEATHGNAEFQELRLSVLQTLAGQGVRAFALEADFGDALAINNYVHGGAGSAEELARQFSFTIYHTAQMQALFQWMHDYNEGLAPEQQLSFYGFDMQNPETSVRLLAEYCEAQDLFTDRQVHDTLEPLLDAAVPMVDPRIEAAAALLRELEAELAAGDGEARLLGRAAHCVLDSIAYYGLDGADYIAMNGLRDSCMAQNVQWLESFENMRSGGRLLIAGHNGHVGFKARFYTPMGAHLKEAYGQQYFAIGTDYFKTVCNINNIGRDASRGDHAFSSADPLAAQAKRFGGSYYLRFDEAGKNGELGELLHAPMHMGSLGEGYSFLMKAVPYSHRIKEAPAELYDAMIFVYEAHPIHILARGLSRRAVPLRAQSGSDAAGTL